ncbi:DUF1801 domain-containing protein [Arenimonas sp.]|uniref:DUF1801 domain-containing protein n=1 Tax=Arenimonas sp. TaxID=1872635 RepID=UPI0035B36C56
MAKPENKTRATEASVDDFLAGITDAQRREDCQRVRELMEAATGAPARMWGPAIVGFGVYHYRYESGREGDWMVTGFSPRKNDLTLYIMPGFAEHEDLMARLGKHRTGKSCLYLKRLADVDMAVLEDLVRGSVAAMAPQRTDNPA